MAQAVIGFCQRTVAFAVLVIFICFGLSSGGALAQKAKAGEVALEAFDHPVNTDQITCYRTASGHVPDDLGATKAAQRLPILSR